MSHQTIVIREEDTTLRIDQVVVPSRISSKITLPVGGDPFTFCDENGGLLLTIDEDGNIISEKGFFELSGQAPPAVSPAGKMRLYFDSAINKLLISEDGSVYATFMAGAGDVIGPTGATDEALVRWDTATGKLIQDSNALLNDAGDLTLVGSQSLGKFLDVTGIAAPAVSPGGESRLYFDSTSNKLRISENGGAFTDVVGGAGDVVGPGSAVDNQIARFDGATGKLIQTANAVIADDGSPTFSGTGLWTMNSLSGFGTDLRRPGNLVFLDFTVNSGVTIRGDSIDFASARGLVVETKTVLATAGATVFEVWNGLQLAGTKVFEVDKDGDLFADGDPTFTGSGVWQINGLFGVGSFLRDGLGQVWLDFSTNQGVIIRSNDFNAASAFGLVVETRALTTAGATILELWNGLKDVGTEVFRVDKDGDVMILGDLDHDGSNVGFYGTTPAAQSAAYTRDATIVEDRTLLASASATIINNNNVLAALIADLQATGLLG